MGADSMSHTTTLIIPLCFQFGGEPREKNEGNESWVDNLSLPKRKENTKALCDGCWSALSTHNYFCRRKRHSEDKRIVVQKMCKSGENLFFSQQSSSIPHQSYFVSNNRTPMEFFDVMPMARINKYKNKTYVKLCSDGFQYVHLRKYVAISLELVQGCCIWFLPFNLTPCCLYNFLCSAWISHEILKTNLCSCVHSISACSLASRFKWACWPRSNNNTFVRMTSELGLANPLYVQLHILWFSWHSSNQQQPCICTTLVCRTPEVRDESILLGSTL